MARKSTEMKRLEAREAELVARLRSDQQELEEVRTAKRVLSRLAGEEDVGQATISDELPRNIDQTIDAMNASEEQTIGDWAYTLLSQSPQGLTSNEILDKLKTGPLPELVRTSLSPPLSRLKKRGKIDLVGDRWVVVTPNGVSG